MDELPTVSPSNQADASAVGGAAGGLGEQGRPRQVAIAGWVIVVTSGVMLLAQVSSAPAMFRVRLGWLLWLAATLYAGGRLAVGLAVLRGSAGARWLYLLADWFALNFSVAFLRTTGSMTNGQMLASLAAVLGYLVVMILLTRRAALVFFGRPVASHMGRARIAYALVGFCVGYAIVAAVAFRLGRPALSIASDRYNAVSLFCNAFGEASGATLLQSSSFQALDARRREMGSVTSLDDARVTLAGRVVDAAFAVNRNSSWIGLLWLVNYAAVVLLGRHR